MRGDDRHVDKAPHQRRWLDRLVVLFGALAAAVWTAPAVAYTAAGDRTFVATLLLPQIAPSDELYFTGMSFPQFPSDGNGINRTSSATVTYDKTITYRLGILVTEGYDLKGRVGAPAQVGWKNTDATLQYMAINNGPHEFLLSLGVDREFGGTGSRRVDDPSGATTPEVFFGKGLGDLDIGLLRPIAITGFAGPQVADQSRRGDLFMTGFSVQYSIPYLESKVQSFALPNLVRAMTPITEVSVMAPFGVSSQEMHTMITVAPGIVYTGRGWEAGVEAQIPMTHATGRGVGVIAQLHLSLDYLFPESIGKPLFGRPY